MRQLALGGMAALAAAAGEPWAPPAHLRAVAEPPSRWRDLARERRRVRLWWDEAGIGAEVQERRGERWVTVARDARPGWTSPPRPPGAEFRVRLGEGRWSPPVSAPAVFSPTDLARLAGPDGALLAGLVGQVAAGEGGEAWASTLGGGLARIDGARARPWTRWEGLPDDLVVAVDAREGRVLAGTGSGAALLRDGAVVRTWDASLPDPYVQAVLVEAPDRFWIGTYRGLARVDGDAEPVAVRAPWSVFSLSPASGGGVWAGYEGLLRVPADAAPARDDEGVPDARLPGVHVYGSLEEEDGAVLAATRERGLVRVRADGAVEPLLGGEAYAVAAGPDGPWVAAGEGGLVRPGPARWGRAQGLPDDDAWSVAAAEPGVVWVGTSRGAARLLVRPGRADRPVAVVRPPPSRWPADEPADDLLLGRRGLWVAGPAGVRAVGRPWPHAGDLVVAAGRGVVALERLGRRVWAVGRRAVALDRRGRLEQFELPAAVRDAAAWDGSLWVGGEAGLWRLSADGRFLPVTPLSGVRRLAAGPRSLWVVARHSVFEVVAGAARAHLDTWRALDVAPLPGGGACVGTEDGLQVVAPDGEVLDALGDADEGVRVPAVAAAADGGCWFAAEDGTVGRVGPDGRARALAVGGGEPPEPRRLVVEDEGHAWVLTERGTWRVRLP